MSCEVVNMVSTLNLKTEIDLNVAGEILREIGDVTYDPKRFPGLILKFRTGMSALIFKTGKVVLSGAKTEEHIKNTIKTLLRGLRPLVGIYQGNLEVQLQNIVGTCELGETLDLEFLSKKLRSVMYVPDVFPGLIYRLDGGPVILIFSTGRLVIVGSKSEEELSRTWSKVSEMLRGSSSLNTPPEKTQAEAQLG